MGRMKRIRDGLAKVADMNRYTIMIPLAVSAGYTSANLISAALSGDMGNFSRNFKPDDFMFISLLAEYVGYRTDSKRSDLKLEERRKNAR